MHMRLYGQSKQVPEISVPEVYKKQQAKAPIKLVDVRREKELIDEGRIPLALHRKKHPVTHEIDFSDLNKNDEIIVSCRDGYRSIQAAEYLIRAGFTNVKSMTGGFYEWKKHCPHEQAEKNYVRDEQGQYETVYHWKEAKPTSSNAMSLTRK